MAHKAHEFESKPRTQDVRIQEDVNFRAMLLPDPILEGLYSCGFRRPSPIQLRAIPLARCGFDLIVHAKSGTGKTCVFTVAALDMIQIIGKSPQVLILAPTREICLQVVDVITGIGCKISGLKVECFIGGRMMSNDIDNLKKGCHIAVGTLGRVKHLIDGGHMNTEHVRLLVLDEFDKLMEDENRDDINSIYTSLAESKQILVCSATYTEAMMNFVKLYMTNGTHVTPENDASSVLLGIRQFVSIIPRHVDKLARTRLKEKQLLRLLSTVSFDQCFVFSNFQTRAQSICKMLCGKGWSADWISGVQVQSDRMKAMQNMKEQKIRVLVTTDITARGIDAYNVNLIINLDIPYDHTTYLHRMGRAGRFGSYGMVITIMMEGEQVDSFQKLLGRIGGCQMSVNIIPSKKSDFDLWKDDLSQFEKMFGIEDMTDRANNESDKNKDSLIRDESSETSVKKCTFPNHIKCSYISSVNSNCLFVTNKSCRFIKESKETIYYDKIPLNVPLIVVGDKLIRLNKFPFESQILHSKNVQNLKSLLSDKLFVKEEKNITLNDFSEIERSYNEFLVHEKDDHHLLNENITKNITVNGNDTEDKDDLNQLSDAANDILLNVIQKDERTKNICKLVNCFDLVAWAVIDKDMSIIKDIQKSSVDIIEFKTEKCESTDAENHISMLKFENLQTFLQSLNSAETIELSVSKQVQLVSVHKLFNIIDASKYLKGLDTSAKSVINSSTTFEVEASNQENHSTVCEVEPSNQADHSTVFEVEASNQENNSNIIETEASRQENHSTVVEVEALNQENHSTVFEIETLGSQEKIHNTSQLSLKQENHSTVVENETLGSQEKINNTSQSSLNQENHSAVFEIETLGSQEKIHNTSQSSEEPAENSSSNRINDENHIMVGKQDSSFDEKSLKKIKRKDGFGRNAKHISEMYPNADIEEENSFLKMCNKSTSTDCEEKIPEKKAEYKRKVKRRRPQRTDNKYELSRKDRKNSNNDKSSMERNKNSALNLNLRECNENRVEKVEDINPTRSNNKEKFNIIEREHNPSKKSNRNCSVQVCFTEKDRDNTSEEQHSSVSIHSDRNMYEKRSNKNLKKNEEKSSVSDVSICSDRNMYKKRSNKNLKKNKEKSSASDVSICSDRNMYEKRSNKNLKRNKGKFSVSDESSERKLNVKRKSDVRKVTKRAAMGDNPQRSDSYHHHLQQNFQNQFQSTSVYIPSQPQWTASMYTREQWSEAYSQWYHTWYRQIKTISQYVEYSSYVSNMLQRR